MEQMWPLDNNQKREFPYCVGCSHFRQFQDINNPSFSYNYHDLFIYKPQYTTYQYFYISISRPSDKELFHGVNGETLDSRLVSLELAAKGPLPHVEDAHVPTFPS